MKRAAKRVISSALIAGLVCCGLTATTDAFNLKRVLGGALKIGGIGYAVDRFQEPLNNFINQLMFKNGVGTDFSTKVVPIISMGDSGYIGAVQVVGPSAAVEQTEAVVQLEGNFNDRLFRVRGLVPVDSKNPTKLHRVEGVGVSAMIDVHF